MFSGISMPWTSIHRRVCIRVWMWWMTMRSSFSFLWPCLCSVWPWPWTRSWLWVWTRRWMMFVLTDLWFSTSGLDFLFMRRSNIWSWWWPWPWWQTIFLVAIIVFFNKCTCKDALVLEARQEGQGIYTTCQSLCHHFNPRTTGSRLFCACASEIGWVLPLAELPILIPGAYIQTRYPSQDDASLQVIMPRNWWLRWKKKENFFMYPTHFWHSDEPLRFLEYFKAKKIQFASICHLRSIFQTGKCHWYTYNFFLLSLYILHYRWWTHALLVSKQVTPITKHYLLVSSICAYRVHFYQYCGILSNNSNECG